MRIKLNKRCTWGGKSHKSGTTHDVEERIAQKLIERGYAGAYDHAKDDVTEEEGKDGD